MPSEHSGEGDAKTLRRLVRLTTERERASLRAELKLPSEASVRTIAAALRRMPRYEGLRVVLGAAPETLVMLREIASELAMLNAGAATNTTLVFLDVADGERKELVLGPQLSARLARFGAGAVAPPPISFDEMGATWPDVRRAFERLLENAALRPGRWKQGFQTGVMTQRPPRFDYPRARLVLRHVAARLERCLPGLAAVSDPNGTDVHRAATRILRQMRDSIASFREVDPDEPTRFASWSGDHEDVQSDVRRVLHDDGADAFNALAEAALLRAESEHSNETADLLSASLWTTRPQLFEIWVLTRVIAIMRDLGYRFEPQAVEATEAGVKWQLSYSRAVRPCGFFRPDASGSQIEGYLYYQLYRASGRAMPDIALLRGPTGRSRAIWTMDPKHSDRRAYTLTSYRTTARRYLDAFKKTRCAIVEHFDRADLTDANPCDLAPGAKLIHNVSPSSSGLHSVERWLAGEHQPFVLVCIDLSTSFAELLPPAISALRAWALRENVRLLSRVVVFWARAREVDAPADFGPETFVDAHVLAGDTRFAPLLQSVVYSGVRRIAVLSDMEFGDETRDSALAALAEGGRHVTVLDGRDA